MTLTAPALPRPPRPARPALAAALALAALAAPVAAAPDAAALRVAALAATCANCHGTQGRAVPGSVVPGLAGAPAGFVLDQLKAFRSGAKPATVMHQIAKGYSDAQLDALATYFANRPR